jgi:hypothetical protein
MALPKELDFLKTVDKYKATGTTEVTVGTDIFELKIITSDDQIECLRSTWEEVPNINNQPVAFATIMKRNVLAYSIVSVNGNKCLPPNTVIYDDETKEPVGSFLSLLVDRLKEWDDTVFAYVTQELENFREEHQKGVEKKLNIKVDNVDFSKLFDFQTDINQLEENDKKLAETANSPVSETAFDSMEEIPEYENLGNKVYEQEEVPKKDIKVEISPDQGAVISKPPRL